MENLKEQLKSKIGKNPWLLLVIFLSFIPLVSLFHPGMFEAHDSQSHVARLVAFYQSLQEGNLIPRWAGNLNMGFGHPVLMFLYPLANYIGSIWHFLGFSFIDSVKLTFAASYFFSGLFMYLLVSEFLDKKAGLMAAVLYQFAPYRFVDLYVRAALGEHLAFSLMPLVLYCFLKLSKNMNFPNLLFGSLSLALLILSHNAISLMFLPFLALFSLILIYLSAYRRKLTLYIGIVFFLGFSLSSFFWLPALIEGKYTLRDMVTGSDYQNRFPNLGSFFYGPWSFGGSDILSKQIGIINWTAIISGFIFLLKAKQKDLNYYLIFIAEIYYWFVLFLMNNISLPVWSTIKILQNFQFPWRFLTMSVLTSSLASISLFYFLRKNKNIKAVTITIILVAIFLTINYWKPQGYLAYNDDYFITKYEGTTDTGESSPKWSIRGMEQKAKAPIELIGGIGSLKQLKRNSTTHVYEVSAENEIQLLDNTVYFPGWEVVVDESNKTAIEYQDKNHRGLITFKIPQGKHLVAVRFTDTKLRQLGNYLSILSFIALFGILIRYAAIRRFGNL